MKRIDLTGQRFGRLEVLEMVYAGKNSKVRCKCDCGGEIAALAYNVRNGNTSSCGCLLRESRVATGRKVGPITGRKNATHGMAKTRTYIAWVEARKRCHSPQNQRFSYYGGRGILVCDRWRESFELFLADMGECPPGLTLERLDNERGYELGNCVWASKKDQSRNRRCNKANPEIVRQIRKMVAAGDSRSLIAGEYGMSLANVEAIVMRRTWSDIE